MCFLAIAALISVSVLFWYAVSGTVNGPGILLATLVALLYIVDNHRKE